ncbi:helix-turn-helix transcriptional regulator [Dactylosporangium aurantiacum]|uniref:Helix-turn-helix transcriptional regulator n=1 Tax=Dactylosporangium aurantiacum TaxID=35754 RepID=A0A9Q9MDD7_9ACTN|nr:helix-turn-helix transcriptional regulator [Dactylosporangium aurantiacum]MDG6100967.1 helix-turn-helix transcriptional regulator [Dactylosporangium aurantiacum]UWZ54983.1 helix-turn-helix transcriptional regulator [Dactylosporangium aurantiacum]
MSTLPRITPQTEAVIRVLLQHPTRPQYGRAVADEAGLATGTIHPILARLEQAGLIESFWESDEEVAADPGRPRRRYYRFTQDGAERARLALADAYAKRRLNASLLSPRPDPLGSGT